jgi:hypothetical protein
MRTAKPLKNSKIHKSNEKTGENWQNLIFLRNQKIKAIPQSGEHLFKKSS